MGPSSMNSPAFAPVFAPAVGLPRSPLPRSRSPRCARRGWPSMGRGFGGLLRRGGRGGSRDGALPGPEFECACGSGRDYGQCCRMFHTEQRAPRLAEELLRARYAAFAYTLPAYIMRTTSPAEREFDRRRWRAEIMQFCEAYQFDGGVEVLETSMTGPNSTTIVFRANMKQRGEAVSFVEMSKFEKEKGTWFYASGKLVEVEGVN